LSLLVESLLERNYQKDMETEEPTPMGARKEQTDAVGRKGIKLFPAFPAKTLQKEKRGLS